MDDLEKEKKAIEVVDQFIDDPKVREALNNHAVDAVMILGGLLYAESESVRLSAARDILDRSGYKPVERKDITSAGMPIQQQVDMSDEQLTEILDGFLKRNSVLVPAREVRADEGNIQA